MSTTRNSAFILSAQLSLLFSGALINFGLGRFLGPGLYGQFGVVYAVATILNLLLTPGLMQAVSKFIASNKSKARKIAGGMLLNQFVLGMALGIIYFFLASPIAAILRDPGLEKLLVLLTPLMVLYGLSAVYGGYLTGIGRFGAQASQLLMFSATRLAATFILAYFFALKGAVAALPIAAFAALLYFGFASKLKPLAYNVKGVYKFAFPVTLFVSTVTFFISTDLFLVKILLQDNVLTGYYTAASAVARIPYFVLTSLGMILLPVVAGKLAAGQNTKKFVQDAFRYVLIFLLPGAALIAATGRPLIMLLYRSEYAAAGLPLSILAVGTAILTVSYLLAVILNAAGRPLISASVALGTLLVSAVLNIALIPAYGLVGAAFATTIASVISLIILVPIVYNIIGNPLNYSSLTKVVAASSIIFIIAVNVDFSNKFILPFVYAGLGILYFVILFALRELRKEDFRRLLDLLPKRISSLFS